MIDTIRYDLLAQEALRHVIRRVLSDAAREGMPGEHHFYITFLTNHEGVRMSHRLKESFPQEMTIILQHQYWDLQVDEEGFSVGLSFRGIPEKISMPFTAIKEFFDPSVNFGLKFEEIPFGELELIQEEVEKPAFKEKPFAQKSVEPKSVEPKEELPVEILQEPAPTSGAEIVSLDKFRKKK